MRRAGAEEMRLALFSSFLDVVLHKLLSVFFEDIINFIDQLIDIFLDFLAGLDNLRICLNFFLSLRFSSGFLFSLLFFHPSTSHGQEKPSRLTSNFC